jgi:type II secretory pathway component PulF
MPVFAHKSITDSRATTSGTVIADSPSAAREILRAQGLRTLRIEEISSPGSSRTAGSRNFRGFRGGSSASLVAFTRELATLLAVGVPLTEAIDTVSEQYTGRFREGLLQLRDKIAAGATLADAMRQRPDLFDDMTISVVEVGENAGRLEDVLETLADFKERWQELANHVLSALIYPAIVIAMAFGVSIFLMTFVVPNILTGLIEEGRPLPWVTTVVKAGSDLLLNHGWWFGPTLLVSALAIYLLLTGPLKRQFHAAAIGLPLLGQMIRKQAIVRMATVIATLMRSGVTFERATDIAAASTANLTMRSALLKVGEAVRSGSDIAEALRDTRAFPRTVVQIFAVGQESGRLEDMLDRLAKDYDRQVYTLARRLTAVLEPAMIIVLAVIVGFIAFATMLPILEAGNVL